LKRKDASTIDQIRALLNHPKHPVKISEERFTIGSLDSSRLVPIPEPPCQSLLKIANLYQAENEQITLRQNGQTGYTVSLTSSVLSIFELSLESRPCGTTERRPCGTTESRPRRTTMFEKLDLIFAIFKGKAYVLNYFFFNADRGFVPTPDIRIIGSTAVKDIYTINSDPQFYSLEHIIGGLHQAMTDTVRQLLTGELLDLTAILREKL
jgi:hypothetical protein